MTPPTPSVGLAEDSSSKWSYPIDAAMPASRAVAVILETLLDVMVASEPGVVERRDEEFLHDYRVAVRRTRSALALFGTVLPEPVRRRGKALFADLGKRTGPARDLDMLALALPTYLAELADADAEAASRLEQRVEEEIKRRYAAIRRWLESKTYRRKIDGWRRDLRTLAAADAGGPMAELAAAALREAIDRVDRQFELVTQPDRDAALHRLRIRFKRLRYALEFSTALVSGAEVEVAISSLKSLQDELGDHQDLVVHERFVRAAGDAPEADAALATLGRRLSARLSERLADLRSEIDRDIRRSWSELDAKLDRAIAALA